MMNGNPDGFKSLYSTTEDVLLGERWTLLVVRDLWLHGPLRFDDLQSGLGISSHTLSNRLATLVEGGILERRGGGDGQHRACPRPGGLPRRSPLRRPQAGRGKCRTDPVVG